MWTVQEHWFYPVPASLRVVMLSNGPSVHWLCTVLNGQVVGFSFFKLIPREGVPGGRYVLIRFLRNRPLAQEVGRNGYQVCGTQTHTHTTGVILTNTWMELVWDPSDNAEVIVFRWESSLSAVQLFIFDLLSDQIVRFCWSSLQQLKAIGALVF